MSCVPNQTGAQASLGPLLPSIFWGINIISMVRNHEHVGIHQRNLYRLWDMAVSYLYQ